MQAIDRSLARRMTVLILLGAGLVVLLAQGYNYYALRKSILTHDEASGLTLVKSVGFQIETDCVRAEAVALQTALFLAEWDLGRAATRELIRRTLDANPRLFGMTVALPEAAAGEFRILYGYRGTNGLVVEERDNPAADYREEWLLQPFSSQKAGWVEPYFDPQPGTPMVTYSVPVIRAGKVAAVVACDMSLAAIRARLSGLPLQEEGMAVLLSRRGTVIAHPNRPTLELKDTIFTAAAAAPTAEARRTLAEVGQRMLEGGAGHMRYRRPYGDDMRMAHMYYDTVPCTGWALGLMWPEDRILAPLVRLNRDSALLCAASLGLLLIPALMLARSVAHPLHQLAESADRLAAGDFEAPLPEAHSRDEVAQLTASFDQMRKDLRRYITELTETTAAKERIAGELLAARAIQMSIVPKLFPPFPDRPGLDLYATLIPALEVGGDLYDFALLDEEHLYLAIGDVSGKGVPASLLMAVGKTLLKSTVQSLRDPALALAHVNKEISEDNETCMFITMFCGILNLRTGNLVYSSAGHNPPVLARSTGSVEQLTEKPSSALGAMPGVTYCNYSRNMGSGDLLVLYTDGVTEAMNPDLAMFGDQGLLDYVRRERNQGTRAFVEGLGMAVARHAAGASQSDDITALAVRHIPSPGLGAGQESLVKEAQAPPLAPNASLELRNHLEELRRLALWFEEQCSKFGLPPSFCVELNLALEEWVVNIISYAYADADPHTITLRLWAGSGVVRVEIEDDGRPFDPLAQAEVDISLPIDQRPIGGLGIHFIRKSMDSFAYRRVGGHNLVTLSKHVPGTGSQPCAAAPEGGCPC